MEGNLETARDFEHVDTSAWSTEPFELGEKTVTTTLYDVAMPARLNESDARARR